MCKCRIYRHCGVTLGQYEAVPRFNCWRAGIDIEDVPIGNRKDIDARQAGRQMGGSRSVAHTDDFTAQFGRFLPQEGKIDLLYRAVHGANLVHGL